SSISSRHCSRLYVRVLRSPPGSTVFPSTTLLRSSAWSMAPPGWSRRACSCSSSMRGGRNGAVLRPAGLNALDVRRPAELVRRRKSEEHTSELQSREKLVCRLLLEQKKRS